MKLTDSQRKELFDALRGVIPQQAPDRLTEALDDATGHEVLLIEPIIAGWLSCSLAGCDIASSHVHTPTGPRWKRTP